MEDSKKTISPSSPNHIASGNNENESEHHRNLQPKTKNFMAPTFCASSKMISPKKKILAEWKPPILESRSEIQKRGISNSNSGNSSRKNLLFSAPANDAVNSDENLNDEESCVIDSCTKPYDPLTNYLSPRPKFLRYNPNRKRKLFLQRGNKMGSIIANDSIDCESSSSSESSSKNEEIEGNKQILEQEVVEEDEDEEQEVFEERNWGLKWVFFKGLVVFFAWFYFTMFVSSMNAPTTYPDRVNGIKDGHDNYDNITLRVVSLVNVYSMRGVDVFDVRKIETPKIEASSSGRNEVLEEENQGLDLELDSEEDTRTLDEVNDLKIMNADFYQMDSFKDEDVDIPMFVERQNENGEVKNFVPGSKFEDGVKDIVAPLIVPDKYEDIPMVVERQNENGEVEILVPSSKSEDGVKETVAPMIVPDNNVVNEEEKLVDFEDKMNDFVPEPNGDFENEAVVVAEDSSNGIEQEDEGVINNEKAASVPELKDVPSKNVVGVQFFEYYKQAGLKRFDRILLGALSVMTLVGILAAACWFRCKKAFTKTSSTSRRRINLRVDRTVGLPPTADERLDQVHQESGYQVNTNLSSVVGERTSRRILGVKQLGELDFTEGFSGSVKSTGIRSGTLQKEESLFAVPDDRRTKRSKGSHYTITPESPSVASVEGKREVSAVRRSARLQSRGVTSP